MKAKVEAIASHGINVFVNRQLVYNYPENLLAEKGVMSIEHADFEGVERLSLVTGGEITSTFDRPDLVKFGRCDLIEEIMIGEDKVSSSSVTPISTLNRLLSSSSNSLALQQARRVQSYCAVQLIKWSTRPNVHYMTLSQCYRKP
jgi:T-complex protein 1 subunit beta